MNRKSNILFNSSKGFWSRGLSFTEILVAMAISLIFMGSVSTAYIQISRASEVSQRRIAAHNRARSAVDQILRDIRLIDDDPALGADQLFLILDGPRSFGDGIDNDNDGLIDEEALDGFDNDGDWTIADDNHAELAPGLFERPNFVGVPDLGDFAVDEDIVFAADRMVLRIPANPVRGRPPEVVRYSIGTFDGEDNVLIRTSIVDPDGTPTSSTTPVIFDVVSLDLLPMNANNNVFSPSPTQRPYWVPQYDSFAFGFGFQQPIGGFFFNPPYEFPSSILVRVTVNSSFDSLATQGFPASGQAPVEFTYAQTIVAVDSVVNSAVYNTFTRPTI